MENLYNICKFCNQKFHNQFTAQGYRPEAKTNCVSYSTHSSCNYMSNFMTSPKFLFLEKIIFKKTQLFNEGQMVLAFKSHFGVN